MQVKRNITTTGLPSNSRSVQISHYIQRAFSNSNLTAVSRRRKLLKFQSPRTCQSGAPAHVPLGISLKIYRQCAY